jgi:hypothetical protein
MDRPARRLDDQLVTTTMLTTLTCEGAIPHLSLVHPHHGLLALPVALSRRAPGSLAHERGLPIPERTGDGHLTYALPGGGRFAPPQR